MTFTTCGSKQAHFPRKTARDHPGAPLSFCFSSKYDGITNELPIVSQFLRITQVLHQPFVQVLRAKAPWKPAWPACHYQLPLKLKISKKIFNCSVFSFFQNSIPHPAWVDTEERWDVMQVCGWSFKSCTKGRRWFYLMD